MIVDIILIIGSLVVIFLTYKYIKKRRDYEKAVSQALDLIKKQDKTFIIEGKEYNLKKAIEDPKYHDNFFSDLNSRREKASLLKTNQSKELEKRKERKSSTNKKKRK